MKSRLLVYGGASMLWAIAVLGAIGLANWLGLSTRDSILLVIAVAVIALFGTFLPAIELSASRLKASRNQAGPRNGDPN